VYLLHGYTAKNTLWSGGGRVLKDLHIGEIADKLIAAHKIEPMILVAPDCYNKYRGSWYTNSPVTGQWEDFITKDLIGHIDAKYRTISKRESRGVAGHSMGGHGAIKIAMRHPELFSALYAMSPAWIVFSESVKAPFGKQLNEAAAAKTEADFEKLHWRAQAFIALAAAIAPNADKEPFPCELPVDASGNRLEPVWKRWLKQDLATTMLTKHRDNLLKYKAIAIDCGTKEDLLPMNIVFSRALDAAGVEHTFEKFEGDHINRVVTQLEEKVLPLFSATLEHSALQPAAAAP
jgi:enterochelin esterase-like enzyme